MPQTTEGTARSGGPMTGVILAGGQSRRMGGRPKALLPWNGRPFIEHQLEQMQRICADIVIVANEPQLLSVYADGVSVRLTGDLRPGDGPLAGMQAAWAAARHDEAWIVACDMPFISAAAAEAMAAWRRAAGCDAVVPETGGRLQPLHGVYGRACAGAAERLLAAGERRLISLLDALAWRAADEAFFAEKGITPGFARNVNDPRQYEALVRGCPFDD